MAAPKRARASVPPPQVFRPTGERLVRQVVCSEVISPRAEHDTGLAGSWYCFADARGVRYAGRVPVEHFRVYGRFVCLTCKVEAVPPAAGHTEPGYKIVAVELVEPLPLTCAAVNRLVAAHIGHRQRLGDPNSDVYLMWLTDFAWLNYFQHNGTLRLLFRELTKAQEAALADGETWEYLFQHDVTLRERCELNLQHLCTHPMLTQVLAFVPGLRVPADAVRGVLSAAFGAKRTWLFSEASLEVLRKAMLAPARLFFDSQSPVVDELGVMLPSVMPAMERAVGPLGAGTRQAICAYHRLMEGLIAGPFGGHVCLPLEVAETIVADEGLDLRAGALSDVLVISEELTDRDDGLLTPYVYERRMYEAQETLVHFAARQVRRRYPDVPEKIAFVEGIVEDGFEPNQLFCLKSVFRRGITLISARLVAARATVLAAAAAIAYTTYGHMVVLCAPNAEAARSLRRIFRKMLLMFAQDESVRRMPTDNDAADGGPEPLRALPVTDADHIPNMPGGSRAKYVFRDRLESDDPFFVGTYEECRVLLKRTDPPHWRRAGDKIFFGADTSTTAGLPILAGILRALDPVRIAVFTDDVHAGIPHPSSAGAPFLSLARALQRYGHLHSVDGAPDSPGTRNLLAVEGENLDGLELVPSEPEGTLVPQEGVRCVWLHLPADADGTMPAVMSAVARVFRERCAADADRFGEFAVIVCSEKVAHYRHGLCPAIAASVYDRPIEDLGLARTDILDEKVIVRKEWLVPTVSRRVGQRHISAGERICATSFLRLHAFRIGDQAWRPWRADEFVQNARGRPAELAGITVPALATLHWDDHAVVDANGLPIPLCYYARHELVRGYVMDVPSVVGTQFPYVIYVPPESGNIDARELAAVAGCADEVLVIVGAANSLVRSDHRAALDFSAERITQALSSLLYAPPQPVQA